MRMARICPWHRMETRLGLSESHLGCLWVEAASAYPRWRKQGDFLDENDWAAELEEEQPARLAHDEARAAEVGLEQRVCVEGEASA